MNDAEFLDDLERRIRRNGGNPVGVMTSDIARLNTLAGLPAHVFKDRPAQIGRTAYTRINRARELLTRAVTRKLMGETQFARHELGEWFTQRVEKHIYERLVDLAKYRVL